MEPSRFILLEPIDIASHEASRPLPYTQDNGEEQYMELLTVKETADMLRVSPVTIRRHIASGKLPAVRIGRAIRIERDAVSTLVEPVDPDLERLAQAKPTSADDPLWRIVGIATSAEGEPTDVSVNHDKYLAEAYADLHE